ncbi:MAG: hypothetical protein ACI8PB_002395 [Desulforhopalus sp.]|jgi:hypothetical protein
MDFYFHVAHSLEKQLEKFSISSKKSELAVLKCRQLLSDMRAYGLQHERVRTKRTRKGESRIKNCVKYNLGGGYRLVTVMGGNHLFVTFFGSHDETDLWFDRHKTDDFLPEYPSYIWEKIKLSGNTVNNRSLIGAELVEIDVYEAQLEARLNETILLSIFQGLNRNNPVAILDEI